MITRRGKSVAEISPIGELPHIGEVKGWREDSDPFFGIVDSIVADRQKDLPRNPSRSEIMSFLLNTSSMSERLRRLPRESFMQRLRQTSTNELFTSTVCMRELRYGCALWQNPELWNRIERIILNPVKPLPLGPAEAVRCRELLAELSKKGIPIGVQNTQIGATALAHDLVVVTFNT